MKLRQQLITVIVTLVAVFPAHVVARSQYTVTDLGTFAGKANSYAYGINNLGQVVGAAANNPGSELAYIWQDGVMTSVADAISSRRSYALQVNDSGYAVGTYYASGNSARAFSAHEGNLVPSFTAEGYGYDINNNNQMIAKIGGQTQFKDLDTGVLTDLGSLTNATAVNDVGQIVGGGVIWENEVFTSLGNLGVASTTAKDINALSQVVGFSYYKSGSQHAFLWSASEGITDLGTLGGAISFANAINDQGLVVGWSSTDSGSYRAALWDEDGAADLTSLVADLAGWSHLSEARDINEQGQIVGFGITSEGDKHAFLLTPVVEAIAGDINNDGAITLIDLLSMQRYILNNETLDAAAISRGDLYPKVMGDNQLDASDMLLLMKLLILGVE